MLKGQKGGTPKLFNILNSLLFFVAFMQCCGSGSIWIRNFCLDLPGIKIPDPAKSERAHK